MGASMPRCIMNRSSVVFCTLVLLVTLTPPAHAQQLQVRLVSSPGLVRSGDDATIAVQTNPGAACRIAVRYHSGPSDARALRPKTADARGIASWTWQVETGAVNGRWPVVITCSAGGRQVTLETTLVTRAVPGGDEGPDCGGL